MGSHGIAGVGWEIKTGAEFFDGSDVSGQFSQLLNRNPRVLDLGQLASRFINRDICGMKRIAILILLSSTFCFAKDVTLTKSAVLKAERSIVSLKAGTVVELLDRNDKLLTIRYGKLTGTIPVASITDVTPPVETAKKQESTPTPAPPRQATTNYGKAVEKAKENAAKHEKNMVKPTDEILQ